MQFLHHPYPHSLSSSATLCPLSLLPSLSTLTLRHRPSPTTTIRMGGGPRTYPGGVSKWQWKRMQANKAKQLLKARLARERHIYEMRKRAELKAAIADLERPWEVVEKAAPKSALFSVSADEQLKVLADRFQKPGGFDLWSDDDGPQLFESPDGLPSARFFPKGVVHSVKPYGRIASGDDGSKRIGDVSESRSENEFGSDIEESDDEYAFYSGVNGGVWNGQDVGSLTPGKQRGRFRGSRDAEDRDLNGVGSRNSRGRRNGLNSRRRNHGGKLGNGSFARQTQESGNENSEFSASKRDGKNKRDHRLNNNNQRGVGKRMVGNQTTFRSGVGNGEKMKDPEGGKMGYDMSSNGRKRSSSGGKMERFRQSHSDDVYDMSLQRDGSYGFSEQ